MQQISNLAHLYYVHDSIHSWYLVMHVTLVYIPKYIQVNRLYIQNLVQYNHSLKLFWQTFTCSVAIIGLDILI